MTSSYVTRFPRTFQVMKCGAFVVGLGVLSSLYFLLGPLRSDVGRIVLASKICYQTADSKAITTFLSCLLFSSTSGQPSLDRKDNMRETQVLGQNKPNVEEGDVESKSWKPTISLRWCAPFFSGGGYCSEAISYVSELQGSIQLSIVQHGDSYSDKFVKGLPPSLRVSHRKGILLDALLVYNAVTLWA